jgi:retinol dehydrogenase-12
LLTKINIIFRMVDIWNFIGLLCFLILIYFGKKYFDGGSCPITADLDSSVVLITGGNVGIGFETAKSLASMRATVIIANNEDEHSMKAIQQLKMQTNNDRIYFMHINLASLESISRFAQEFQTRFQKLDILINNAGIICSQRRFSTDGFELTFAINYVGHAYLSLKLIELLKASKPSRIISLSSVVHKSSQISWDDLTLEKSYGSLKAYGQTKLALLLFGRELNKRLESQGIKVVSVHPGVCRTNIIADIKKEIWKQIIFNIFWPFWYYTTKSSLQGAQTTLYCSVIDHKKLRGGHYYVDCKESKDSDQNTLLKEQKRLWDETISLINSKGFKTPHI